MANLRLLVLLMIGSLALFACELDETEWTEEEFPPEETTVDPGPAPDDDMRVFEVTGENFVFYVNGEENADIVVQEGDWVRIEFESIDGFHDWVVDEFDAATDQVWEGESSVVEFRADAVGTYEYYCSVGQHRDQGMYGRLIVE